MARKKRATTKKKAPRRGNTTVVVAKTRHHKRRAVRGTAVGSTAVGKTHHKKRKKRSTGVMGFTTGNLHLADGVKMGFGVAAGIIVNRKVIKPAAIHVSKSMPAVGKFMGLAQAALGFAVAMKGKGMGTKAFGVTVMGGGIDTILTQVNAERFIPGISGPGDDYTTVTIPISGPTELRSMVAGLLTDNTTPNFGMVAETNHARRHRSTFNHTYSNSGDMDDARLRSFVGDSEYDVIMPAKGADY